MGLGEAIMLLLSWAMENPCSGASEELVHRSHSVFNWDKNHLLPMKKAVGLNNFSSYFQQCMLVERP